MISTFLVAGPRTNSNLSARDRRSVLWILISIGSAQPHFWRVSTVGPRARTLDKPEDHAKSYYGGRRQDGAERDK